MHHHGTTVSDAPNSRDQPTMIFPWAVFDPVEEIKLEGVFCTLVIDISVEPTDLLSIEVQAKVDQLYKYKFCVLRLLFFPS
jgi:hypothetical protein